MADIFDEVDEILGEVDTTVEASSTDSESNFNEAELQDIMAEIENLEKDFESSEETTVVMEEATPVKKTQLQEEIERELAMSQEVSEDKKEEIIEVHDVVDEVVADEMVAMEEGPKVLSFSSKVPETSAPVSSTPAKKSEVSLAANGQMSLNLSFKVGEESAVLTIDPEIGLSVSLAGVDICICESVGCKVTMENGVSFTIPLTSTTSASKKKVA